MAFLAEGAGDANYNGTYEEAGTHNSKAYYSNGSRVMCWDGFGGWEMKPGLMDTFPAYYITATAYNDSGLESGYSNEVVFTGS